MATETDLIREFCKCADELRTDGIEIRTRINYCGRGMGGRTCFGVVGGWHEIGLFMAAVGNAHGMDFVAMMGRMTYDSMGHNVIAYWPSLETDDATMNAIAAQLPQDPEDDDE